MSNGILQVLIYQCQIKIVSPNGTTKVFMVSEINTILDMLLLTNVEYEVINYAKL